MLTVNEALMLMRLQAVVETFNPNCESAGCIAGVKNL
jgi:hypothetical protein